MKKTRTILALLVGIVLSIQLQAQVPWTGSGTSADPYLITNKADLKALSDTVVKNNPLFNNASAHYRLTNDIDLSGMEWVPIGGNSAALSFKSKFHGGGHVISNLTITGTTNYRGLFGYVDTNAIIDSLQLVNARVKGGQYIGSLAAYNRGIIRSCSSINPTVEGSASVGGLVGYMTVQSADNVHFTSIENSYVENVTIKGVMQIAGGFIGASTASITKCYVSGQLTSGGHPSTNIGGFSGNLNGLDTLTTVISECFADVIIKANPTGNSGPTIGGFSGGFANGTIRDCYSYGKIMSTFGGKTGGFVGGMNTSGKEGRIINSYAMGNIEIASATTANGVVGGFVGEIQNSKKATVNSCASLLSFIKHAMLAGDVSTIVAKYTSAPNMVALNDYYRSDISFSGFRGTANVQGTAKPMTDFQDQSFYADSMDMDFGSTWSIVDGNSTPYFQWQSAPVYQMETRTEIDRAHDSIYFSLENATDSVLLYKNDDFANPIVITGLSVGENKINIPNLLNNAIRLVVFEPGKVPSYPVEQEVFNRPTITLTDIPSDTIGCAEKSFTIGIETGTFAGENVNIIFAVESKYAKTVKCRLAYDDGEEVPLVPSSKAGEYYVLGANTPLARTSDLKMYVKAEDYAVNSILPFTFRIEFENRLITSVKDTLKLNNTSGLSATFSKPMPSSIVSCEWKDFEITTSTTACNPLMARVKFKFPSYTDVYNFSIRYERAPNAYDTLPMVVYDGSLYAGRKTLGDDSTGILMGNGTKIKFQIKSLVTTDVPDAAWSASLVTSYNEIMITDSISYGNLINDVRVLTLAADTNILQEGRDTMTITASLPNILWTSSDTTKAKVDQNGKVETFASGKVFIIAKDTLNPCRESRYAILVKPLTVPWSGTGSSENPYLITNKAELKALSDSVAKNNLSLNDPIVHYRLTNDIDLSGTEWAPIGGTAALTFKSKFHGGGHVISNLTITGTATYRGLFGYVDTNAIIDSLGLINANIKGASMIGSLAGFNRGIIRSCYAINPIVEGTMQVGGLVGQMNILNAANAGFTLIENSYVQNVTLTSKTKNQVMNLGGFIGSVSTSGGRIDKCYASGRLFALELPAGNTGGFVGNLQCGVDSLIKITNCFADVIIQAPTVNASNATIGGFSGAMAGGLVQNCYAYGRITAQHPGTGSKGVAGFIGGVSTSATNKVTLKNNYAMGSLEILSTSTTNGNVGGFIAGVSGATGLTVDGCASLLTSVKYPMTAGNVAPIVSNYPSNTTSISTLNDYYYENMNFSSAFRNAASTNFVEGTAKPMTDLQDQSFYADSMNMDFGSTWSIVDGNSAPYFQWQSAPVYQMETRTEIDRAHDSIYFSLENAIDSVLLYKNDDFVNPIVLTGLSVGENKINIPNLLNNAIRLVVFEPGKLPSYPVEQEVFNRPTITLTDIPSDTIGCAEKSFTIGIETGTFAGENVNIIFAVESKYAGTLKCRLAYDDGEEVPLVPSSKVGEYYVIGANTPLARTSDLKMYVKAEDYAVNSILPFSFRIEFENRLITSVKDTLKLNNTPGLSATFSTPMPISIVSCDWKDFEITTSTTACSPLMARVKLTFPTYQDLDNFSIRYEKAPGVYDTLQNLVYNGSLYAGRKTVGDDSTGILMGNGTKIKFQIKSKAATAITALNWSASLVTSYNELTIGDISSGSFDISKTVNVGTITADTSSICVNQQVTMRASIPGGQWVSANAAIASMVDSVVTGVSAGTTTIYYIKTEGCSDTAKYDITVNGVPTITTQPQGGVYGSVASLSVEAVNAGTVSYQWYKGTELIEGANANTLNISTVGGYKVRLNNAQCPSFYTYSDSVVITPKPLTISGAAVANKVYDATTTATLTAGTLTGIVSGDSVVLNPQATATFNNKNAGTAKAITLANYTLTGKDTVKYTLVLPVLTANITAKGLTVNGAAVANKVYDATTAATLTAGTLTGIITGDVVSINTQAKAVFDNKNAGTAKVITLYNYTLTGTDAANYMLTAPVLTANITKAPLVVKADSATVAFGFNPATFEGTYVITGFVEGEAASVLTTQPEVTIASTITSTTPAGRYEDAIVVDGAAANNYEFSYVNGTLTINAPIANQEHAIQNAFEVYPNPTTGKITITVAEEDLNRTIDIYALTGVMIQSYKINSLETSIDLSTYAKGTYVVRIGSKFVKVLKN